MRKLGQALVAFLVLCSGFSTVSLAQTNAEKNIVKAQPLIQAALFQPISELNIKAQKGAAEDWLILGMAIYLGFDNDSALKEGDAEALKAFESRVLPIADAYIIEHRSVNIQKINWKKILKITNDEGDLVARFAQARSANYWVTLAAVSKKTYQFSVFSRPTSTPGEGDRGIRPDGASNVVDTFVVPYDLILTSAHCVHSIREKLGISYAGQKGVPASVRLLQFASFNDLEAQVESDLINKNVKHRYSIGSAACGSEEQFNTYVTRVRSLLN